MNRLASGPETSRERIRAAFLRTLSTSRDSTFTQIQRIRRLIRFSGQISGIDDSDNSDLDLASNNSSSDDLQYFNQRSLKDREEDSDSDTAMTGKLVDEEALIKILKFDKGLPKKWIRQIVNNEIDLDIASKYILSFLLSFLQTKSIMSSAFWVFYCTLT